LGQEAQGLEDNPIPPLAETNAAMFPLSLTCLEEYMLCDDRPAYPMTGVVRLRFSGFLDCGALEAALATVVQRHPLLRATVRRTRWGRPKWVDHPDWRPVIQWQAEANPYGFPNAGYMDLTQEPGTRVWVVERDDGHDLIVQGHHCCTDASGANKVLEDLLIGYALNLGTAMGDVSLPALDPQRLRGRGAPGLTVSRFLKMAHKQAVGLGGVQQFLSHSPVPLVGQGDESDEVSPPPMFPTPLIYEFDPILSKELIATAKTLDVTVNDLLARDLFLAVGAWRKKGGIGDDRDWLRFSIPMNLRTLADEQMPMTNSVSMVFLDRQASDFADPCRLLEGIHEQMQLIKRLQLQYTFILSLGVSRCLPGGLSRQTQADTCRLTTCLSNLGPVLTRTPLPRHDGQIVSGNVVLESVDYVIPLRPFVNAAFCVYTYADRLRVLMHFDPRTIPDESARDLLEAYVQQIRHTIGSSE
jgi:hypothetical protein